jgi:hypothetical protein
MIKPITLGMLIGDGVDLALGKRCRGESGWMVSMGVVGLDWVAFLTRRLVRGDGDGVDEEDGG